ncbi:MipA/OmpV family protein [Candidatus Magnetaquicoccus inordinatus]|uniref:MipA/OmpV family protein n=1 Tax=Candidatus Magnetaquicoccus inordinatus TaxID=2496818 RepID=UPI00223931F2|nr:MipA/OmpV family protein [Candidatus Magnetaquicoccus inordinatus]
MKREYKAIPILQYENQYVRLFGPGLEIKLPGYRINDGQKLHFGLVGRYALSAGYESDDSRQLAGMNERKGGVWAGAKAKWESSVANITAEWTTDLSGHSNGHLLNLGIDKTWRFDNQVMLTPRLQAKWQDSNYIDYYFGVRDNEIRAGRAAYKGNAGISPEFALRTVYKLDPHHSIILDAGVTALAPEIKDSPLVDRSTENNIFLGYLYRF